MIFSHDEWPGGHNIAYSPKIWRRIFETWGDAVGMNYDPSHLVWQMIDQTRFLKEFGPRIVHAHAKDVMIDRDGLYENGVMSVGMGWQMPRMPGLGDVDWSEIFSGLYRAGYDGAVCIEHEDRSFEGDDEAIKRGFLLARDVVGAVHQMTGQPMVRIAGISFDHMHMGDLLRMVHDHPDAEICGIWDPDRSRMADGDRQASAIPEDRVFTDLDACLATGPDLAILCSAPAAHAEMTERLAPARRPRLRRKAVRRLGRRRPPDDRGDGGRPAGRWRSTGRCAGSRATSPPSA